MMVIYKMIMLIFKHIDNMFSRYFENDGLCSTYLDKHTPGAACGCALWAPTRPEEGVLFQNMLKRCFVQHIVNKGSSIFF